MNTVAGLLAEQSIFAQLVIKHAKATQNTHQRSTINNPEVYKYAADDEQVTPIDPTEYSIINLPDAIAYIPNNSIFGNIALIQKSSPDYRFVPINGASQCAQSAARRIVSEDDITTATAASAPVLKPSRQLFSNDLKAFSSKPGAKPQDDIPVKFRYEAFEDPLTYAGFDTRVVVPFLGIARDFNADVPTRERTWYEQVVTDLEINDEVSKSMRKTPLRAKWIILKYLRTNSSIKYPYNYTDEDLAKIENAISSYVGDAV